VLENVQIPVPQEKKLQLNKGSEVAPAILPKFREIEVAKPEWLTCSRKIPLKTRSNQPDGSFSFNE